MIDGTWPAAERTRCGPFVLRRGDGGGSRVSAATAEDAFESTDIDAAVGAMRAMRQTPLFMVRPDDGALDTALEKRDFEIIDPVNIYTCPVEQLTDRPIPRVTVFNLWEPLAIMREIWAAGGIGPERLAVMDRVQGIKTGLLARHNDKPGGTGFVAIYDGIAMVHALEIVPHQRRNGLGKWMMRGAAFWALDNGADTLSVICTKANTGANALYRSLGLEIAGHYHYRRLT